MGKFEKKNRPQIQGDRPLYYSNQQPVVSPRGSASGTPKQSAQRPTQARQSAQGTNPARQPAQSSNPNRQPGTTPNRPKKKKKSAVLPIVITACAAVLVIAVCLVGYFALRDDGLVADNVYVAGIDLSGMTREEAVAALQDVSFTETMNIRIYTKGDSFPSYTTTYDPATEVVVDIFGKPVENPQETDPIPEPEKPETDPDAPLDENGEPYLLDTTLCLPGVDVNVSLDVEKAVTEALSHGRGFAAKKNTTRVDIDVTKYLTLDEDYIRQVLKTTFANTDLEGSENELKETTVILTDADGNPMETDALEITLGTLRRQVNIDDLYDQIVKAYMSGNYDLQYVYDETFPTPVDLDALYKEYKCKAPVSAFCDEETYEITDGENGYGFTMAEAVAAFAQAKPGDTVTLPLRELVPTFTRESLEAELFCDVLSSYDSPHVWNPTRTHNLELAAEAIDGTILKPGEIFSFNDTVGERTAEKGYGEAGVYVAGKTENQLGGGVCQVASTLFYCTIKADLEVIERAEHQFLPTYVPYGMDATVYWGYLDYQFRNNTTHPIRIDASVYDGYVHVRFVGTNTKNYTVELDYRVTKWYEYEEITVNIHPEMDDYEDYKYYEEGEVITSPYTGADVTTYMYKYDLDGNLISSEAIFWSEYDKRDKEIAHLGTGEEDEDPSESTDPSESSDSTESSDPTESTDPSESTEPPTESTEPPTESTEPPTESTEPPTESTEPLSESTEAPPPTDPSEASDTP